MFALLTAKYPRVLRRMTLLAAACTTAVEAGDGFDPLPPVIRVTPREAGSESLPPVLPGRPPRENTEAGISVRITSMGIAPESEEEFGLRPVTELPVLAPVVRGRPATTGALPARSSTPTATRIDASRIPAGSAPAAPRDRTAVQIPSAIRSGKDPAARSMNPSGRDAGYGNTDHLVTAVTVDLQGVPEPIPTPALHPTGPALAIARPKERAPISGASASTPLSPGGGTSLPRPPVSSFAYGEAPPQAVAVEDGGIPERPATSGHSAPEATQRLPHHTPTFLGRIAANLTLFPGSAPRGESERGERGYDPRPVSQPPSRPAQPIAWTSPEMVPGSDPAAPQTTPAIPRMQRLPDPRSTEAAW